MKKFLSLLAIMLTGSSVVFATQAERQIPGHFRGNWIDTVTNLWTLSLWDRFAVADASFWKYGKWNDQGRVASALLTRQDGVRRKLRLELLNDSTLLMREGKTRCVLLRESPTTARRPFTAPPDTVPFRSKPWVNDSIRVEGFITGYKPGDAVYHYWSAALLGFGNPNTPMNTDSLGRFRAIIPSTHEQIHIVGTDVAAGPGDRIFIAYSTEGERHLFMGDNARVNQELDAHRPYWTIRRFLPKTDPNERIADAMSWRFARLSGRDMALTAIDAYCREHNLSRKTQQAFHAMIKGLVLTEIGTMPSKRPNLGYPYRYYLPGEGIDYADPELFFWSANYALLPSFLALWRGYEPLYIADRAGLQGKDRETFLDPYYIRSQDPERFRDFISRNLRLLDSLNRTLTFQTRLQWALPIADTMLPEKGLHRDIVFAQGFASLWTNTEEPLSEETLALIDSTLSGSPFLRDTLRGLNDRYRLLAERNAALALPQGTIDSALSQPDSILAAMLRPYAGKAVCVFLVERGTAAADKELKHLAVIREKLQGKEVEFILVTGGIYPQKWRNTIAEYDLGGEHTIQYDLPWQQVRLLAQKYFRDGGYFLLVAPSGSVVTEPDGLKPSNTKALTEKIEELLGR